MTTQNNTQAVGTKQYINLATKKRGFLAHDAKYFDRTCAKCKGMYSSSAITHCPKCGAELGLFKIKGNKTMAITECTIFPMLRRDDEDRLKERAANDTSFMPITYRFKLFSFAENGAAPSTPPELMRLKEGAMVEFTCFNTPEYARKYHSEKLNRDCVELMFLIFKDRGSSIKVIRDPKAKDEYAIAYKADAAGNPVPIDAPFPKEAADLQKSIDEMEKTIASMKAVAAEMGVLARQPAAATQPSVADESDPFGNEDVYIADEEAPF